VKACPVCGEEEELMSIRNTGEKVRCLVCGKVFEYKPEEISNDVQ
jgi:hypothetical protein